VEVGTNQTLAHPVQMVEVVIASSLKYQVLATSLAVGATIHAIDDSLQIKKPQEILGLDPNGAEVSKPKGVKGELLNIIVADVGEIEVDIPTRNWVRVLIVFYLLKFYYVCSISHTPEGTNTLY
jgi:hypothetical protein